MTSREVPHFPFKPDRPAKNYPALIRNELRALVEANENRDDWTPEEIVERQVNDATYRLHEDKSGYPRFPWNALDDIAGPMSPGELWLFCARTGNGKTLFLLNLWDALIEGQKRCGLYIGLEQSAEDMRTKWACTMSGVHPNGPLAGKWPFGYSDEKIAHDLGLVSSHMQRQKSAEVSSLAHFSNRRFIDAVGLQQATEWAVDHGAEFVIVDHLNRIDITGGRTAFEEHTKVVRTAKEMAVRHGIAMLCASQVGRPNGDPLQRFMPPALHEMRGGGTSEEEANTVLGIFRPLIPDINDKALTEVRQGRREEQTIYQPDIMAVRVLKHRLDGLQLGNQALLRVTNGRLYNRFG